jgi:hypothetical protein
MEQVQFHKMTDSQTMVGRNINGMFQLTNVEIISLYQYSEKRKAITINKAEFKDKGAQPHN